MINKILRNLWVIRFLPAIVYFNLRMLPFKQSIFLPIWLYKPKLVSLGGAIRIKQTKLFPGMIRIGEYHVNLFPNNGCMLDIKGLIIFEGETAIGNNSYISVGKTGTLVFGQKFRCNSSLKIACYDSIVFGARVLVGWDCMFMDTDFHTLKKSDGTYTKGYGPISVGDDVWFGCGCKIFKNSRVSSSCVISAQSVLQSAVETGEKVVLGQNYEVVVKADGRWHCMGDDSINYI